MDDGIGSRELRKANESLRAAGAAWPREFLFDEFWREGELCLFFGETGTGKSVLALQIAEALARGTPFDGFRMPRGRRRVLYVDLVLRDEQFGERCAVATGRGRRAHTFSENLHRDRPVSSGQLIEWLHDAVRMRGIDVVIVDDLNALKRTHDGVRETLAAMRQLRVLRDELGISILVLTDAANPGRREEVSEADLGRGRVLCGVADAVFGIGKFRHSLDVAEFYLVQTRVRSAPVLWTHSNTPYCRLARGGSGLLLMRFETKFAAALDPATRRLIRDVRELKDEVKLTFRAIAKLHGISKSTAARLYHKWVPAMDEFDDDEEELSTKEESKKKRNGNLVDPDADLEGDDDEGDNGAGRYEFLEGLNNPDYLGWKEDEPDAIEAEVITREPEGPQRRSVYDLQHAVDATGTDIYVEQSEHHTNRPLVWYLFERNGDLIRLERGLWGVARKNLGQIDWIDD